MARHDNDIIRLRQHNPPSRGGNNERRGPAVASAKAGWAMADFDGRKNTAGETPRHAAGRLINDSPRLILASRSPRRFRLLKRAGIKFSVKVPQIKERQKRGEKPILFARRGAKDKALSVARKMPKKPGVYVLAADTIVVLKGKIMGKPANRRRAKQYLTALSGRTHHVITGYAIVAPPDRIIVSGHCRSRVTFKKLSAAAIERYVRSGEPLDKAGAYAVQAKGGRLIQKIEGSLTNVVGLPMEELTPWLRKLKRVT